MAKYGHGFLTPDMCLIDGGWRLRIAGFGFGAPEKRGGVLEIVVEEKIGGEGSVPNQRLAFVAPERVPKFPRGDATLEGDIYRWVP